MSGKQRFLYWRYILLLFILIAGCSPPQSDLSEGNPVTELADAIAEEISYATDIRVLNFISTDKMDLVLYYYKVGRAEIDT